MSYFAMNLYYIPVGAKVQTRLRVKRKLEGLIHIFEVGWKFGRVYKYIWRCYLCYIRV